MSIITYPLNGVMYDATDAETYLCTRKSGVYSADECFGAEVTGNRTVVIGPGLAWISNKQFAGKSVVSNAREQIEIPTADGALPRIDRIVLRYDKAANASVIALKQGAPASSPQPPAVQQGELIYELGLYTVYVAAASLTVSMADVTSTMLDESVCGLMTDGVTGLPTQRYEDQWVALMERLNEIMGGVAGVTSVNGKMGDVVVGAQVLRFTFPASGWTQGEDAAYRQTVSVAGVVDNDGYDADADLEGTTAEDAEAILEAWSLLGRIVAGNGTVTAYAYGYAPDIDVPIMLRRIV